jgi:hypothetical protein
MKHHVHLTLPKGQPLSLAPWGLTQKCQAPKTPPQSPALGGNDQRACRVLPIQLLTAGRFFGGFYSELSFVLRFRDTCRQEQVDSAIARTQGSLVCARQPSIALFLGLGQKQPSPKNATPEPCAWRGCSVVLSPPVQPIFSLCNALYA